MESSAERPTRRDYGKFAVFMGVVAAAAFTYWYDLRVGVFAFLGYFVCYFVVIPRRRSRAGMEPPWENLEPGA